MTANAEAFLIFRLREEWFALPIACIREVLLPAAVTPIPQAPPSVQGMIQLRGRPLVVVDLAQQLGMPHAQPGPKTRIVLTRLPQAWAGLIVDSVEEIFEAGSGAVFSKPSDSLQLPHVAGMARIKDKMTILLDLVALFTDGRALSGLTAASGGGA